MIGDWTDWMLIILAMLVAILLTCLWTHCQINWLADLMKDCSRKRRQEAEIARITYGRQTPVDKPICGRPVCLNCEECEEQRLDREAETGFDFGREGDQ